MAFAAPRYLEARRQARINVCVGNQRIILRKLEAYRMINNEALPTQDQFQDWLQQNFEDVPSCPEDTRSSLTSYGYSIISGEPGISCRINGSGHRRALVK